MWTIDDLLALLPDMCSMFIPHLFDRYFTSGLRRRLSKRTTQRQATVIIIIIQIRRVLDFLSPRKWRSSPTKLLAFISQRCSDRACDRQPIGRGKKEVWDSKNIFPQKPQRHENKQTNEIEAPTTDRQTTPPQPTTHPTPAWWIKPHKKMFMKNNHRDNTRMCCVYTEAVLPRLPHISNKQAPQQNRKYLLHIILSNCSNFISEW